LLSKAVQVVCVAYLLLYSIASSGWPGNRFAVAKLWPANLLCNPIVWEMITNDKILNGASPLMLHKDQLQVSKIFN